MDPRRTDIEHDGEIEKPRPVLMKVMSATQRFVTWSRRDPLSRLIRNQRPLYVPGMLRCLLPAALAVALLTEFAQPPGAAQTPLNQLPSGPFASWPEEKSPACDRRITPPVHSRSQ